MTAGYTGDESVQNVIAICMQTSRQYTETYITAKLYCVLAFAVNKTGKTMHCLRLVNICASVSIM